MPLPSVRIDGGCLPPGKQHHPPIKKFGVNHPPINNDHSSFTYFCVKGFFFALHSNLRRKSDISGGDDLFFFALLFSAENYGNPSTIPP